MSAKQKIAGLFTRKWALAIFGLLLLAGIAGCIEIIDFNVNRQGNRLVVDGIITDKKGPYILKLRRTSYAEKITDPLGDAGVRIYDDEGNNEAFHETREGTYLLEGNTVKGIPGRTYHIEITLPNGTVYQSRPETMPLDIAKDSVYYKFDSITKSGSSATEVVRVFTDTDIPAGTAGSPLYLRWDVEEAYKFTEFDYPDPFNNPPPVCYVTDDPEPQKILLFDGSSLDSNNINGQEVVTREIDYTFYQRHYINVIQYSISQKAHRYWSQVDEVVNSSGTIFDVPPATAEGNIFEAGHPDNKALGYFEAARVDTSRFFLVHADLPIFISNPCKNFLRNECTNCMLLDNSSSEPPFYWLND